MPRDAADPAGQPDRRLAAEAARRESVARGGTEARRDVAAGGHDAARRDVAPGRDGEGAEDAHVRRDSTAEDLARRGAAARREAAAVRPDAVACVRSGRSHRTAAAVRAGLAHLSVVAPPGAAVAPVLRVVDVAPRDAGERVLAYLEAKARFAQETGAFEHHVVTPGRRALRRALGDLEPDVVLLHDPSWWPRHAAAAARAAGARVVTVHHRPAALAAAALPGPDVVLRPAVDAWRRHAAKLADVAVVAGDAGADAIATRPGLEPGLGEHPGTPRGDAVLYAGPFAPGRGVELLLDAAARSREPWPLHLAGTGAHGDALFTRAVRLGLGQRVAFRLLPAPARRAAARDRAAGRAALFAGAACVVLPAPDEPAAPVALEAAAAGARVVACAGSPAADALGPLAHRFAPRDPAGLLRAIAQARSAPRDPAGAAALRERHAWPTVFADELAALRELIA